MNVRELRISRTKRNNDYEKAIKFYKNPKNYFLGLCIVLGNIRCKDYAKYAPWRGWESMHKYYPEFEGISCPEGEDRDIRIKYLKRAIDKINKHESLIVKRVLDKKNY